MNVTNIDYRQIIKSEFKRRSERNNLYSLRAYARDLKMSPSKLSEVLSKKRGISKEAAVKIARQLELTAQERKQFVLMVQVAHARSALARAQAEESLKRIAVSQSSFDTLSLEKFETIANWIHFTILELTHVTGFKSSLDWIARRLKVETKTVKEAVERLKNLNLLSEDENGQWTEKEADLATPDGIASRAIKSHHHQILKKADELLDVTPLDAREYSSTILAIDSNKIAEAKEALKEFRRSFCKDIQSSDSKDAVYCLGIQFFPLDSKDVHFKNVFNNKGVTNE